MRVEIAIAGRPELMKGGTGKHDGTERIVVFIERAETFRVRGVDSIGDYHAPFIGDHERIAVIAVRARNGVKQDNLVLPVGIGNAAHRACGGRLCIAIRCPVMRAPACACSVPVRACIDCRVATHVSRLGVVELCHKRAAAINPGT